MSTLSTRIVTLRKLKNISVKQAAFEIGMQYKYLESLESCDKKPSIDEIALLASYYDVSFDYLVGCTDDPQGNQKLVID